MAQVCWSHTEMVCLPDNGRLVHWEINVPFQHKKDNIGDKIFGGDLVLPG